MASDDRFFRELEHKNQQETRRGREKFVRDAEAKRDAQAPAPESFRGTGLVSDKTIDQDAKTCERLSKKFGKPGFVASALELVVNNGVNFGIFFSPEDETSTVETINTNKYDDYINRVDTAVTVHREGDDDLTFAIDLYSGDDLEKARQKIATSSNDESSSLFAGFTEIRYYEDTKTGKKRLKNVPRYCIGVGKDDTLNAVDEVGGTGNLFRTVSTAMVQFKMIYEMTRQNELYMDFMYDYADDFEAEAEGDEEYQKACKDMEDLDKIYRKELIKAKKALGPEYAKMSPEEIAKELKKKDSVFATILDATEDLRKKHEEDRETKGSEETAQKARKSGKRIVETLRRLDPPKAA